MQRFSIRLDVVPVPGRWGPVFPVEEPDETTARRGLSRAAEAHEMDPIPRLSRAAFPLVVSGPSGVGKTLLCDMLLSAVPDMVRSISATTRARRGDEIDGADYFFLREEQFLADRDSGKLAEWARVHDNYYGTPRNWVDRQLAAGHSMVLNIDVQGGLQLRRCYPDSVLVFILPPDIDTLRSRLESRGTDSAEAIDRRLENMREEIAVMPEYDFVVVNDDLGKAGEELIAVVRAERVRISRRLRSQCRMPVGPDRLPG